MSPASPLSLLLALAAALLLVASASASDPTGPMPDSDRHRITVPRTIGGVTLGDSFEETHEAWGGNGKCREKVDYCRWGGGTYLNDGAAAIEGEDGIVKYFFIGYYDGLGKDKPRKGIARFQTKEGLGLSKPLIDVKKAYPKAKEIAKPSSGRAQAYRIDGDNGYMIFGGGKRIEYIFVSAY